MAADRAQPRGPALHHRQRTHLSVRFDADTACVDRKIRAAFPSRFFPSRPAPGGRWATPPMAPPADVAAPCARPARSSTGARPAEELRRRTCPSRGSVLRWAQARSCAHQTGHRRGNQLALVVFICDLPGQPVAAISTIAIASRQPAHRLRLLIGLLQPASTEISDALIKGAERRRQQKRRGARLAGETRLSFARNITPRTHSMR